MKPPRYALSLDDKILIAIGRISAQWATLEYYVSRVTVTLLQRFNNPPSKLSEKTAFVERRLALFEAASWKNVPSYIQEYVVGAIERIEAAENKRHMIIHGMAAEIEVHTEPGTPPEKMLHIMRDHPKHFFSEHLKPADINKIADDISEANGVLVALYFHLWGVGDPPYLEI